MTSSDYQPPSAKVATQPSSPVKAKIWNAVTDSLVKHIVGYVVAGVIALLALIFHYFFG